MKFRPDGTSADSKSMQMPVPAENRQDQNGNEYTNDSDDTLLLGKTIMEIAYDEVTC